VTGTLRVFTATLIMLIMLAIGIGLFLYMRTPADRPMQANSTLHGAALYAKHCAACHGTDLEGQPNWRTRRQDGRLPAPPHDETGHTWHHPDQVLFAVTKHGTAAMTSPNYKSDMRGFGDVLSDREIWAVLDFIKSRWPEEIRKRQATISARQQR
jgi:mono/diheme cytochrome c family protein